MRNRLVCMAGILALLLWGRALGAQPPPIVIVTLDAGSEAQKQAIAAIRAHVSGLPLDVVVVPVERERSLDLQLAAAEALAASRSALGTFSLEVGGDGALLIYFTEASGEATLIRRLRPNAQGRRVALEQVAIVVRSLIEALLDGGNVGIGPREATRSRSPSPASPQPQPARLEAEPDPAVDASGGDRGDTASTEEETTGRGTGTAASAPRWAVAAGGTVTSFADGAPWQTGLALGAQWRAKPELSVGARYTVFPSLTLAAQDATASVARHPLDLLVGYRGAGSLALCAEMGVQMDRVSRATVRTAAGVQPTADDARWLIALGGHGGFSWSPWVPVITSLRVGADVLLTPYSYAIDPGADAARAPQTVFSTRRVRPRLELELVLSLW